MSTPGRDRTRLVIAATFAAAVAAPAYAQLSQWTDVSTPALAGVNHEGHRGAAWADYDGDGLIDLYATHWGPSTAPDPLPGSPNQLFRNMGGGVLVEATVSPVDVEGVPEWGLSHHPAWGDIDNDGLLDLFVTQSSNFCQDVSHLFRQTAPGVFEDVTGGEPLSLWCTLPRAVSWVDLDLDGMLDIFTANSGGDNVRNRVMMNQGDGTFLRIDGHVLEVAERETRGVAWCDFNNDGLQDVYFGNGFESYSDPWYRTNVLFLNLGGGQFIDIAGFAGVAHIGHARGVAWGDINNDGWMDLLVGNNSGSDYPGHNILYLNNGDLTFTDISVSAGIWENRRTRDVSFADYDNDGWLDMYVVNFGSNSPPNRLYRNLGDNTFVDLAFGSPLTGEVNGSAATWGDYDNDGWVDIFLVGGSTEAPGLGENRLCRNDNQNGNHWIEINLVGVASNRLAVGARVSATTGDTTRIREVQSGSGYNSQHMHRVHIGLGDAAVIDTLEIRWPSGRRQVRTNVVVDQVLTVTEAFNAPFDDCNGNGIADVIEISDGTVNDCDHDGVPDGCDGSPCDDCNGNGEADFIDIVGLVSFDCDDDLVPDECVIAADPMADINGNGILDACESFGDADQDGDVDVTDLVIVIGMWGPCPPPCIADFDGNGAVDVDDLIHVILNWS